MTLRAINSGGTGTATLTLTISPSVTLHWVASTSQNITGYNIYRGTTSGGPYGTRVNPALISSGTTYIDTAVQAGQTYYYVATAVDISGNESIFSTQAMVVVPSP